MVGQCLFCSWYGVRLRRAAYVEGGPVLYHPHCVRIALNSPDPSDRALAERIFKTEMPKLARNRFWEMNPPNVTVNPEVPTQELSIQECDRLCRENAMGTAETIERFLAGEPAPAAHASLPPAAPEVPPPPPR